MRSEVLKSSFVVTGWASGSPLKYSSWVISVFVVLFKGVAMVETMRTNIGISPPLWVLMLIEATSILLLSGCLAPKDKRQMSYFLYDCNDSRLVKSCERKEHWEPSSNRMLASASESVVVIVAIAVFNRWTHFLCGSQFESIKVEKAVVLFSVVLLWETSLLSVGSASATHIIMWCSQYVYDNDTLSCIQIPCGGPDSYSKTYHIWLCPAVFADWRVGSLTVYTGKFLLTFCGVACWSSV